MMTQAERRRFLIEYLISEDSRYKGTKIPTAENEQRYLLRALMNVRVPGAASDEFLHIQDEYLLEENASRGITDIAELDSVSKAGSATPANSFCSPTDSWVFDDLYLWRGDITTLKVGAIVNAANSGMTGCYQPCHACIDNCIHTFSGIQLRSVCANLMKKQGFPEPTGKAKITPAFNLPCDYVLHTVGPIISGTLTQDDCDLLASCYTSCLDLAAENSVLSVAFCCISTGVFCFPADKAAQIAVHAVTQWKLRTKSRIKVIFNVFLDSDELLYKKILLG